MTVRTSAITLPDETATLALGARLAERLEPGTIVLLEGDLGAGKTTLVRGLLRRLGYAGRVKSPTYGLVELYDLSRLSLYHFDFYRLENPKAWREAGFAEYFDDHHVCLVEWPEKAGPDLPAGDLRVALSVGPADGRTATIVARSDRGGRCLDGLIP